MGFRLAQSIVVTMLCLAGMTAESKAAIQTNTKLEECLKKAEELPDIAAANAELWFKQGGGEDARFCHASAQFNRGEFTLAGRGFAALAALREKTDARKAAELHARAGSSFTRANDAKNAEKEFNAAIKLESSDPDIWIDRAAARANTEHYWDAISDLNQALRIAPDIAEAYRLRGQAWLKLGNSKNARADFLAASDIEAAEQVKTKK